MVLPCAVLLYILGMIWPEYTFLVNKKACSCINQNDTLPKSISSITMSGLFHQLAFSHNGKLPPNEHHYLTV